MKPEDVWPVGGRLVEPPDVGCGSWEIINGDSRVVMAEMEPDSVDSIITDPPYMLNFMSRAWDSAENNPADDPDFWREALRVAKPGAHLLAFGGSRTYHRMANAIELAGWEIRDCIMCWVYVSGFPKSHNIARAIDKEFGAEPTVVDTQTRYNLPSGIVLGSEGKVKFERQITVPTSDQAKEWEGWGSAMKPSYEPVVVARKPMIGTLAKNVLTHRTGGLNIDGTRVPVGDEVVTGAGGLCGTAAGWDRPWKNDPEQVAARMDRAEAALIKTNEIGRWTPNLILAHGPACDDDACQPDCPVANLDGAEPGKASKSFPRLPMAIPDPETLFFPGTYQKKPSPWERNAGLDDLPEQAAGGMSGRHDGSLSNGRLMLRRDLDDETRAMVLRRLVELGVRVE